MYWSSFLCAKRLSSVSEPWTRLFVKIGNLHFRRQFVSAPYHKRMLFMPFCLRSPKCPMHISREEGILCPEDCGLCRLGEMKRLALELGYLGAHIVVSSRIVSDRGLKTSKDFIWSKIEEHQPSAALGLVCIKDFRNKYLKDTSVGPKGVQSPNKKAIVAPQGLLLAKNSCVKNSVDWNKLERLLRTR